MKTILFYLLYSNVSACLELMGCYHLFSLSIHFLSVCYHNRKYLGFSRFRDFRLWILYIGLLDFQLKSRHLKIEHNRKAQHFNKKNILSNFQNILILFYLNQFVTNIELLVIFFETLKNHWLSIMPLSFPDFHYSIIIW